MPNYTSKVVLTYLFPYKCIQRTVEVWPYSVCKHWPDSAFHTFKVLSVLPLTMMLPCIWEDQTPPVWPTNVLRHYNNNIARVNFTSRMKLIFFRAYLAGSSWPDFERIVVRTRNDAIAAKLKASDNVVVMTFQHSWLRNRPYSPIQLDISMAHVSSLKSNKICFTP